MKNYFLAFFSVFVLFLTGSTYAVRMDAIYKAYVPVVSQTAEERNKKLPEALAQVIIKASGNSQALNNPKLKTQLNNAGLLMQEFSYASSNDPTHPFILEVQFDPVGVNKLLSDAASKTWGSNRPLTLVWMEYQAPNHPAEIIDTSSTNQVKNILQSAADQHGLPIIFPVMDMSEMTMPTPVWQTEAKRYNSDAILVAHVTQTMEGYALQAKLMLGNDQWSWNLTGQVLSDVINQWINNVTDTLAGRYATVISDTVQTKFILKVTGVTEQSDFSELLQYLQHLTPVASAEVMKISGSDIELNMSLRGTRESFIQAISIGKKLTPAADSTDSKLVYQWNH